jgi:hypothetical protein
MGAMRWWGKEIVFCVFLSLMLLTFSVAVAKKHQAKTVSAKCVGKVQKDMDCILGKGGQWVSGKFAPYEYAELLHKSGWEECNRPVLDYVWNFSTSCSKMNLKKAYSRDEMCEVLSGKTVMIVGDSINNQLFVTMASALWPDSAKPMAEKNLYHYDKKVLKDANGVITCELLTIFVCTMCYN